LITLRTHNHSALGVCFRNSASPVPCQLRKIYLPVGLLLDWALSGGQNCAAELKHYLSIDVSRSVDSFPVSTQQVIEIAKALSLDSRILLLDEPTSALNPDEVQALFVVLRKLANKGIGIVYVSHHLSEVFEIADRITVLRDGHCISTTNTMDTSQAQVVNEMLGGAEPVSIDHAARKTNGNILKVNSLSRRGKYEDVSFSVKRGEIVGLAGLLGARRNEIVRALVGLESAHSGNIEFNSSTIKFRSIRDAMKAGIGYIPEERKTDGLFLNFSLSSNLAACSLEKHVTAGFVSSSSIRVASQHAIDAFSVKAQSTEDIAGSQKGLMWALSFKFTRSCSAEQRRAWRSSSYLQISLSSFHYLIASWLYMKVN